MTYKEFTELQVPDDCKNQSYLNFHFNDKDPTDLKVINGGIVYNGFFLISYDKSEMVYFKDYEVSLVPDGPSFCGNYYYLKPLEKVKITYLYHTKKQMLDLINELKEKRQYWEKQKSSKEKIIRMEMDFK